MYVTILSTLLHTDFDFRLLLLLLILLLLLWLLLTWQSLSLCVCVCVFVLVWLSLASVLGCYWCRCCCWETTHPANTSRLPDWCATPPSPQLIVSALDYKCISECISLIGCVSSLGGGEQAGLPPKAWCKSGNVALIKIYSSGKGLSLLIVYLNVTKSW